MNELRSLEEIEAWAKSKALNEVVGYTNSPTSCPLATCHNELDQGARQWHFGSNRAYYEEDKPELYPIHIDAIITYVDSLSIGVYTKTALTAQVFLEVLVRVHTHLHRLRKTSHKEYQK